ncbi:MAG: Asp-tRNA(Asn)/Glu-tRNA(Gln) amidotransferase subunit GatC [Clostridiales bacterium]|nr:Asp-tRNA(Asn)/Glu-tRNA(Gln) amidotransferase subunit GatC [Clostridiales bacterium]
MNITKEQLKHIANLSNLSFNDEELEKYLVDMTGIVDFVNQLNEINTDDVEITTSILGEYNIFREDEIKESFDRELLIQNAPDSQDGMFKIPRVIE